MRRRGVPLVVQLECRRLFTAAFPSDNEQYMVELINRARANPGAEATRLGVVIPPTLNTPKQPLAINPFLVSSARGQAQYIANTDSFTTTGPDGSTPDERMTSAGYTFGSTPNWGENVDLEFSSRTTDTLTGLTRTAYEDEFRNFGLARSSGGGSFGFVQNRDNFLDNSFKEIGPGIGLGTTSSIGSSFTPLGFVQDFGTPASGLFITGVAYIDNVTKDKFYTPGEGLGGVQVFAQRISDGKIFSTATWSSGGYSLGVSAGTYNVTVTSAALGGTVVYQDVPIDTENVKLDFTPDRAIYAAVKNGVLTIQGTADADVITVSHDSGIFTIGRNGFENSVPDTDVTRINVLAGDGVDNVTIGSGFTTPVYIDGGTGNDVLIGGDGNDTINGGAGKDKIAGGLGDDKLKGGGGHDNLSGGAGKDRLYGGDGNDTLSGGSSSDRLYGEAGNDMLLGDSGNDFLYARDGNFDTVFAGTGNDSALIDLDKDLRGSLEILLS